jgi:hypothetical protein
MLEDFFIYYKDCDCARRSKRCNWCLLSCCVLSLSEGHFVIGVYTSLANYILHLWGSLMYFSSHISSHGVIILLSGLEHAVVEHRGCQ